MNSLWASRGIVATAVSVPLAALAIAACGGGGDTPRPPMTASGRPATVGLEPAGSLGKVFVDSRERTVYVFRKDSGGKSSCAAPCAAAWFDVSGAGQVVSRPAPKPGGGSMY
jgi:predicted lipoprotein with Yx(FWY)xxD motif